MISVCLASYNGEKYIHEQLDSILCQIDDEDEIIVSDDGSTDKTLQIISNFADNRIKIFSNNNKKAKSKFPFYRTTCNFENALKRAKGDIIFLADQDDVWETNKIEVVKNKIDNNILLVHNCKVVDKELNIIHHSYFDKIHSKSGIVSNMLRSSYMGCCMVFKKELLNVALPFPKTAVPHDIWLGLLAEFYGKVIFCNDKLLKYRRHENNLSVSAGKSNFSFLFKIQYRFLLYISFIKRII